MFQKEKQLSKQNQLIDQSFSNTMLLNTISSLENLAFFYGYKGKKLFDYYSGDASLNDENALINAVILQLQIFRASHSDYVSKFTDYNFPNNLTKNQMIKKIKEWKEYVVNKNSEIYFDELIKYLDGDSNTSGIEEQINQKKKEWGKVTNKDLQQVGNCLPFINNNMFDQIEIVKNSYKKNGDYQINAVLYRKKEDNKLMQKLRATNENFQKKYKEFKTNEENMENYFNNLLNKINNDEPISKIDDTNMNFFISQFSSSLNGLEINKKEINEKIAKYNEINNKAANLLVKNPNCELIVGYCVSIIQSYQKSLGIFNNK